MSLIHAHIRALRALAVNLQHESDRAVEMGASKDVRQMLYHQIRALDATADQLESEQPKLREESPITYDPKGKR